METPNTLKSKLVYHTPDGSEQSSRCGSRTRTPMSASLKERLKRTRRSFNSPFSVAKRLKVDSDEEAVTTSNKTGVNECAKTSVTDGVDFNRNQISGAESALSPGDHTQNPQIDLFHLREKLKKEVRDKTEKLRRLKMAQMYRTKNDLTQLQSLIGKWRSCSQAVLLELQSAMLVDGRKASISQLIDHFGLDDAILHFDRTEDDFRDS
ncbi:swi5-dependent recombination DNA repair protein 1 homolog [Anguilla rostrata]|uniref:swi5-dependent recombination DNA repair protein 1 homolog n=1 Tax=Anguilla rostrata TaxID=7938 RepID=UPI0030D0E006